MAGVYVSFYIQVTIVTEAAQNAVFRVDARVVLPYFQIINPKLQVE